MEYSQNEDVKMLIDVLSQGNAHIAELEAYLYNCQTFSSEACLLLSSKIQSTFATAITMTKLIKQRSLRSPLSANDRSFQEQERREMYKKRQTLPRWSGQVQACSGSAMEIPTDDGYSWRKYGQKDILGAKHPRCYFRCTHRHSHGCVATKQVQRSDNDSSFFDITYRGAHTCNNGFHKTRLLINEESVHQNHSLNVKTETLSSNDHKPESFSSFSFLSTPASCLKPESQLFSSALNPENNVGLDSEIADIICASTSTTSLEMLGMDFGLEQFVFNCESFDFC